MNEFVTLIKTETKPDSIGNQIQVETRLEICCEEKSITQGEFFAAGEAGLHAVYKLVVNSFEYSKEKLAEYKGERYQIYRAYTKETELTELYLAERVGV